MHKSIFILLFIISCLSCNLSNRTEKSSTGTVPVLSKKILEKEIKELERRLLKAKDITAEMEAAKTLVSKSQELAEAFPNKKNTADVLFKAADVARGIGDYGKAIQLWGMVWRNYPDYIRAPDAIFMQGFTYENNLKDMEQAKNYYFRFLEKHPNHPLEKQVALSLKNLGKTPEDLIKEFQKKNKN